MYSTSSKKRLFVPVPNNPLHGGNGVPDLSSERMIGDTFPHTLPTSHSSTNVSLGPDYESLSATINTGSFAANTANSNNTPSPTTKPTMQLIPAFLLVPNQALAFPQGTVPIVICVPPSFTQFNPSLENVTQANLRHLMVSKAIVPMATHPSLGGSSQQESISLRQFLPQLPFTTAQKAAPFPNTPVVIQAAITSPQPPLTYSSAPAIPEQIPSSEEFASTNSEPITTSTPDDDVEMSGDDDEPLGHTVLHRQTCPPSPHSSTTGKASSHIKLQQQHAITTTQRKRNPQSLKQVHLHKWVNELNRFWYLLCRGDYTQREHETLVPLLNTINENKANPGLDPHWLKTTKLIGTLEKYEKDETMHKYDPWVRGMTGKIVEFWRKRFGSH